MLFTAYKTQKVRYVKNAKAVFAGADTSGTANIRKKNNISGMVVAYRKGFVLPNRECTLSIATPVARLANASMILAAPRIRPTAATEIPTVSV